MKATQFIFGGIILLLCAAMFLILKSEMDEKHELMMEELARSRQQSTPPPAPAAQVPAVPAAQPSADMVAPAQPSAQPQNTAAASVASAIPATPDRAAPPPPAAVEAPPVTLDPIKASEEERLLAEARKRAAEELAAKGIHPSDKIPGEEAFTPLQAQIAKKPAIARIEDARSESIAQGFVILDRGSQVNLEPRLRFSVRRGTMIIGEVVIGDTVQEKNCVADVTWVVPGVVLKAGDEIIDYFPPNSAPPAEGATADLAAPALNPSANPDNVLTENSPPHETSAPVAPGEAGSPLPAPDAPPRAEPVPEVAPLPR